MKKPRPIIAIAGVVVLLAAVASTVLAPMNLSPGQSIDVNCPTRLTGYLHVKQAHLVCATATPAPTPKPTATPVPTAVPTLVPTATPTPVTGLPTIPAQYGSLLRWVGTSGALAPFRVLTYPDDHIGQPGQFMTVFNRFRGHAAPTVHDGYLDLRSVRQASGPWFSDLVGTSQDGNGPTFGYGVYRFWLSWNLGPGVWQASWLYDTTTWTADEIDWTEMLENQQLAAHVLGTGAGSKYGLPIPADIATAFHMFTIERRAGFTAFSIDGVEVARVTSAQSTRNLAILLDSKVGFPWMGSTGQITAATPAIVYLHVAAVTVDP